MTYFSPRSLKHARNWALALILVLVPLIIFLNFLYFGGIENLSVSTSLVLILLGDFVFGLIVAVFLGLQLVRRAVRQRGTSVGSPIQLRLSKLFAIVSLISAVAVAVVAMVTVNEGLGGFLRVFINESVDQSRSAAQSYFDDEVGKLRTAIDGLANSVSAAYPNLGADKPLRQLLQEQQGRLKEKVDVAFLIDGSCNLLARGSSSYLYNYTPPPSNLIGELMPEGSESAGSGACSQQIVSGKPGEGHLEFISQGGAISGAVYRRENSNQFSAIHRIGQQPNLFLLVANNSIGSILNIHDVLKPGVAGPLDTVRRLGEALIKSSIAYLLLTLVIVSAMVGLGIAIARRISKPIEELAATASEIEGGVSDVKVRVRGDDEVAMLGQAFNQMLERINSYTDNLIELRRIAEENRELAERREQSFSSVLSNVTAGVMGLDRDLNIIFMNRSAGNMLEVSFEGFNELHESYSPHNLSDVVPEFATLHEELNGLQLNKLQKEVDVARGSGLPRRLLVQFADRSSGGGMEGYVIAFDDITELVKTKERAAWSTAAKEIAHEIRNPLYPMLLAVQDMQDLVKAGAVNHAKESFTDYLEMIEQNIKNADALADSFAEFAKLPDPKLKPGNVCTAVDMAVNTQLGRGLGIAVSTRFDRSVIETEFDSNQLHSVLVNLLKNAGEAVSERRRAERIPDDWKPQIRVSVQEAGDFVEIRVMDNGPGFPVGNRNMCLQPFFSTKREATRGLGLPYVDRVISGHGGSLILDDAPGFDEGDDHVGAMAVVRIPLQPKRARKKRPLPVSSNKMESTDE